jgi:hypothetical protein
MKSSWSTVVGSLKIMRLGRSVSLMVGGSAHGRLGI